MSKSIAILGASSSGKTTALRNIDPKEMMIVSPHKRNLPFLNARKNFTVVTKENPKGNLYLTKNISMLPKIASSVSKTRPEIKYLVFDDMTHFFTRSTTSQAFLDRNEGNDAFQRWNEFGMEVAQALCEDNYRDDLWIISIFHTEQYATPHGDRVKLKTPGKLLDSKVDLPSYYEVSMFTHVDKFDRMNPDQDPADRYKFVTNDDGFYPARSPIGLFNKDEMYIPNDLKAVLDRIDIHTGFTEAPEKATVTKEEVKTFKVEK